MSRFDKTYCSQCGGEFGPGDEGFSHCTDHQPKRLDCLPVPTDRNQGWPGVYAVLYTDEINGEQTSRDDLWIATSAAIDRIQTAAYAEGRKDEAEEHAWRPIETAPEDELILVATTGDYVDTAHWTNDGDGVRWWWSAGTQRLHQNLKPTHWMPLPTHPAPAIAAGSAA